jgi:hypothetical protein
MIQKRRTRTLQTKNFASFVAAAAALRCGAFSNSDLRARSTHLSRAQSSSVTESSPLRLIEIVHRRGITRGYTTRARVRDSNV